MPDMSPLAYVIFGFLGGVLGAIAGVFLGLIGLFFGWPFFAIAFGCTVVGGLIGFFYGSIAD